MQAKLTDQAVVAVAIARVAAGRGEASIAHLLHGLATEAEGRAGVRLRERASAAVHLAARAHTAPAPPMETALLAAIRRANGRAATTVDLLDAAIAEGGQDIADLLATVGYHRDLDGWLASDPADDWFEHPETYGFHPMGDPVFDGAASRVVAQVRAVRGGAVELLVAAAAAPDAGVVTADPSVLTAAASRLRNAGDRWDFGLEAVIEAAQTLSEGDAVTIRDLVRAALVAGGDGPKLVLELAGDAI